jgi:RNA polymerase sigma factor (sigma-70 family)
MDADVNNLTDTEIVEQLQISGGRRELLNILHSGSEARTEMMRSNIRLVVSIAKKWIRKGIGHTSSNDNLMALYDGGWDRPSFDDVIQEGVLGLARAVDKYEPSRGLRFSTYSSYWISNYIRQLFLTCSTGSLKIPTPLHEYKNAYKTIIKRSIELMIPFPTEEAIASEIGTTVSRLRTALRVTDSLLSIDQPIYMGGGAAFKGSGAGGDLSGDVGLLISDTLQCSETRAEELVDVCFLRQCLENAMATELSPHERDVIRLRLGLDDGQSRTVKEVAEECGGGVSVSEIRSVEKRAFKKLRNPSALHAHNLMDFLDMIGVKGETLKNWNWY